jgi:hypothetical protein
LSIFALVALAHLAGCTSETLRRRTVDQGATFPELQYQQVLDNLALFSANPSALPWHVNVREGTTQITDSASFGAAVDLGPPSNWLPQLFGSRTAVAQWGGSPVIDTLELRLLRIAYRRAHGSPEMPDPELLDELAHELKNQVGINSDLRDESELFYENQSRKHQDYAQVEAEVVTVNDESFIARDGAKSPLARDVSRQVALIERELASIGTGWFCVGGKWDVPRDACYVGRYRNCWVWVPSEGRDALTEFTLAAMKLSTLIKETQTLISPGSVKFSPGDRG